MINLKCAVSGNPAFSPAIPSEAVSSAEDRMELSCCGKIPSIPVLEGNDGIRFDFNEGLRVLLPQNSKCFRLRFSDLDTGTVLHDADAAPGDFVTSVKKFFIRFRLEIFRRGETAPVFTHDYDAAGREVMIQLPFGTIGDSIGWFSYAERFREKHGCRLICVMKPHIAELVRKQYPEITFITAEESVDYLPYACYYPGLFFGGDMDYQPVDFRRAGLHRTAGHILNVDLSDIPPRLDLTRPRRIREPYVCIAVQSTSRAKYWNNPDGWREVVKFLKKNGYRVLCVDRDRVCRGGICRIPRGAEDFTGALPLQERVDLIKDADFFVGLSSGLPWLAWACLVPVVLISGFTHPSNEFATPYRVINRRVCHGCWNDPHVSFDHGDFWWCPRHRGTERQFECTRLIPAGQVIGAIRTIPAFQRHIARAGI